MLDCRQSSNPAPVERKVLMADGRGNIKHHVRSEFANLLRPGDVVVANDAATLPASLSGRHSRTGRPIEVRLAGRDSLDEVRQFSAVVFGEGDFRTRTESRARTTNIDSRRSTGVRAATGDCGAIAESSALHFVAICGIATGDLGRFSPARATYPVFTRSRPHLPFGTRGHRSPGRQSRSSRLQPVLHLTGACSHP